MMVPSVDLLLVAGRAVFLIFSFAIAAYAFTVWRRATRLQAEQATAGNALLLQRLAEIEARVDAAKAAIVQLGELLQRPAAAATPVAASAPPPGYQIAIRLARGGASREELMADCGLSQHEAQLVQRLHGPRAAAAAR